MDHLVKLDYKDVSLNTDMLTNAAYYNLNMFNGLDEHKLQRHLIRPYFHQYFKEYYEYENSSDTLVLDCAFIITEVNLQLSTLFGENSSLNKLKQHNACYNNVVYLVNQGIYDYINTLLSDNAKDVYNCIMPTKYNPDTKTYLHIGINLLPLSDNIIPKLLKLKKMYNIKFHIFGGISVEQYVLYKDVADYFYIGNIGYKEEDVNYTYSTTNRDNITFSLFYSFPINVNYAELIYKCNLVRIHNTNKAYPKIVVMDMGFNKNTAMTVKDLILSFALGADYITSCHLFMSSKYHLNAAGYSNFYNKPYNNEYYQYIHDKLDYNDTVRNFRAVISSLFKMFNISDFDTLHKLAPKLINAPWKKDNSNKQTNNIIEYA